MGRISFLIVYWAVFYMVANFAAAQTVHIVGDSMGWGIPPNTSASYSNWASGKTFMVGDILVFNFMTNEHDVVQVPRASYDDCSDDDAINSVITTGPANMTLDSAGDHYYICTLGRHCDAGQKLSITVVSSSTPGGATPPMTAPSPVTPQPDACAPTTTGGGPSTMETPRAGSPSSSPPNSASVSLASSFLLIITFAGVAVIF